MAWLNHKPRRLPLEARIQQIAAIINRKGEASIEDVVMELKISFTWARRLMRAAEVMLPNVVFDEVEGKLKKVGGEG